MIIKRKTQIILALIISSVFLFQGCASVISGTSKKRFPERREGSIIITKKDGRQIEGELITVKENSLLLLDRYYGRDVSIEIRDIRTIRIVKRSKAGLGSAIGSLIVIGVVALVEITANRRSEEGALIGGVMLAGLFSIPASILGGIIGAVAGKYKTIHLEGMTDPEIKEALRKLRKKARIRDYK